MHHLLRFLFFFSRFFSALNRWLRGNIRGKDHGKAYRMHKYEMIKFLSPKKNKGLILSENYRLSFEDSFKNLCLVAPTGSGKTTRFVIPNLLKLEGSAVVTDPSGEIYERTSGHLQSRGFRIQVISPAHLDQSLRFNPLCRFRTQPELKQLANTLCQNNTGSDTFWQSSAG